MLSGFLDANTHMQAEIGASQKKIHEILTVKHFMMSFLQKLLDLYMFTSMSSGRLTEGSSVKVPPGHTNFAIPRTVPGIPLTIERSSVLNSTANSSEGGTTLGDRTLEWMVRQFFPLKLKKNNSWQKIICGYFLFFQIKIYVSSTALLKVTISFLPWPAKLRMGHFAHRTASMSALMGCVR